MKRILFAVSLAVSSAWALPSAAQDPPPTDNRARAQQLFDSALSDAEKGDFASACPKFLASQDADPKTSTLLNLANCYEKNGQTASAWGAFREAEIRARKASRTDWESSARARAEALEPKLLRLSISVAPENRVNGLIVSRDGSKLAPGEYGVAIPVDPGEHTLTASAEGRQPWEKKVTVNEPNVVIEVPLLTPNPVEAPLIPVTPPPVDHHQTPTGRKRWSTYESVGAGLAAGGVAGLLAGGIVGLVAKGDYNDARARCREGTRGCPPDAVADADGAYGTATGATVIFIAGAALLVGGAALYFFAPPTTDQPMPTKKANIAILPNGIAGRW